MIEKKRSGTPEGLLKASNEAGFLMKTGRSWTKELGGERTVFKKLDWRNLKELGEVVELQDQVWGMGDKNLVPENILAVIEETGGDLITAGKEGKAPDGFVLCLATDNPEKLFLHMVGVRPEIQSKGIARNLMVLAGINARERGIKRIDWTYDPIMGANANLYLSKLGAIPYKYTVNKYGIVENKQTGVETRYKNVETDRFTVRWNVGDTSLWRKVLRNGSNNMLIDPENEWLGQGKPPEYFRVSLPQDFTKLSTDEMMDWRRHLRGICLTTMDHDNIENRELITGTHEVVGFGVDTENQVNCYIFKKR
jgi:chorismate synthase